MRHASAVGFLAATLSLVLSAASCAPAYYADGSTRTYLGFTVGVSSNAPPPPRLYFRDEPRVQVVVSSGVRVVEAPDPDCDLFVTGGVYYLYRSGYWYRSRQYDGDYQVIEVTRVPRAVLEVPPRYWRNHPGRGQGRWKQKGHDHDRGRW